jgi:hypothetical protein
MEGQAMMVRSMGALAALAALTLLSPWMRLGGKQSEVSAGAGATLAPLVDTGIGINLDTVADWSPAWVFVDVFKHARPWLTQLPNSMAVWDSGQPLTTDRHGWPILAPGQAAATLMLRDLSGNYPGGTYRVFYKGQGQIEFGFDAKVISSAPGEATLQVTPSNAGIFFKINASDPKDPIREVSVVMPGFENSYLTKPFHPLFVERLAPFETLRFMQWSRANESPLTTWKDRPTTRTYTQATKRGVAFEHMVELTNQLACNAWITLPHLADDEFVRQTARLWASKMHSDGKLFVEFSNEVWNSIFPQAHWSEAQGLAAGLSTDSFQARLLFYAKRSAEVFQIFKGVFDSMEGQKPELVCVLATQYGNPWTSTVVLGYEPAAAQADALAIAPYFGIDLGSPANLWTVLSMSTEQILEACEAEIDGPLNALIAAHEQVASSKGVELIAYEAGQHLVGFGGMEFVPSLTQKLVDANRHSGMHDLYVRLMQRWHERGGQAFVAYSHCGQYGTYGSWGALEHQAQPISEAHKYRALMEEAALH